MRRSHRLPRSERGSALVVTMMVILAVTGLGAVAFTSALQSANLSQNAERGRQAAVVAEVGMMAGVEWLECNLSFLQQLEAYPYVYSMGDEVGCNFQPGALLQNQPFGERSRDLPVYSVAYSEPVPARRAPEFDESYCYVRIDMLGTGGLFDPDRASDNAAITTTRLSGANMTRRFNGQFYAGPVRCPSVGN